MALTLVMLIVEGGLLVVRIKNQFAGIVADDGAVGR